MNLTVAAGGPVAGGAAAMIGRLAASGPDPALADRLALFGRFVGSWDMEIAVFHADGRESRLRGEWHFGWILEGRAIQDVLITWPAGERPEDRAPGVGIGSTVRTYDPERDEWWIVWQGPSDGEFGTLLARPRDDGIVLESQWSVDGRGRRFEWSFSEIGPESFRWQGRVSSDGGATWRLGEEMHARRRVIRSGQ